MVGLSIVLEKNQSSCFCSSSSGNIICNKLISKTTTMSINISSSSSSSSSSSQFNPAFLEQCYLCKQKLLPEKDIYMYKGDKGFCSEECRYKQIFMDEEETLKKKENCCLASVKMKTSTSSSASSPSSSSGSRRHHHRRAY